MNKFITFSFGAAVGSLLTWKLLEKKYIQIIEEEVQSVVDYYKNKDNTDASDKKEPVSDIKTYDADNFKISKHAYVNEFDAFKKEFNELKKNLGYEIDEKDDITISKDGTVWVEPGAEHVRPYVISPEEFAEIEYYDQQSWTYYSDGIITDSTGEIIVDPETYIGDTLDELGIYEDDSLHVRNENMQCDFEIIKCEKSFKELNTAKQTQEDDI